MVAIYCDGTTVYDVLMFVLETNIKLDHKMCREQGL